MGIATQKIPPLDSDDDQIVDKAENVDDGVGNNVSAKEILNNIYNTVLLAFKLAVLNALTIFNMVNGIMDEFEDESGVDTVTSTNEDYDSANDLYSPEQISTTELDYFEYADNATAQAAYVSSDGKSTLISQLDSNLYGKIGDDSGTEWRYAQSFTLSSGIIIEGVSIEFNVNQGTPEGNVTFRIETDNGGVPSGTLANANLTKTFTPVASSWNDVMFSSGGFLSSGLYWIVAVCDNQDNEHWSWSADSTSLAYAGGNMARSTDGGSSWNVPLDWDMAFKVYASNLQCYSESTIKEQGSYSLKAIAKQTDSLNDTLTRTVSPTIDLSGKNTIKLKVRASRTGSNFKIGIHDSGGTTTEHTVNIASADTWQEDSWDISGVADANKDAIDQIKITILNADVDNTIYLDNIRVDGETQNMTLVSSAQEAENQPDNCRIIIFEEDTDSATLNTDLKAYCSRDSGANWVQATLSDKGDYTTGKRILVGESDVSNQAADKTMKYKIETLNNKDLKLHCVAILWD